MSGEIREDIQHLRERFEEAPDSRLFAPLADAYRKDGDIDTAIELCEKGLERYPSYASAHVILGKCFYDKGATERARSEFLRVVELDPENMVALKFLGDILGAEGDREGAAQYYRRLIAIDPTNEDVEKALSELEQDFQVQQIDLTDEKQVRKIDGAGELATMTLAGIYAAQGYYNRALKIYQDVIQNDPGNAEARQMVEKLEALMSVSEEERKEAFDDEVLTISLDDVTEEVASSTAGMGGVEHRSEGRVEREPVRGEKESDELAEAVQELERTDKESGAVHGAKTSGGQPGEETIEEAATEEEAKPSPKMGNFQEWLRKLQSDKDHE